MMSRDLGRAFGIALVLGLLLLAGCGKRNSPVPPPGQPNTYPRVYPNQ